MRHSTFNMSGTGRRFPTLNSLPRSRGFTLVELMMVIAIIAVLGSLAVGLLRSARIDANRARTQTIVQRCRTILQTKLETFESRTLPFRVADVVGGSANITQKQALRSRMLLEWVMSEMPTCYEQAALFPSITSREVIDAVETGHSLGQNEVPPRPANIADHPEYWPAAVGTAFANRVKFRPTGGLQLCRQALSMLPGATIDDPWTPAILTDSGGSPLAPADPFNGVFPAGDLVPNALVSYEYPLLGGRDLLFLPDFSRAATRARDSSTIEYHSLREGAECLYAILAASWDGDRRGIHFLSDRDVGDTDGDGRLEVLDSFGDPLFFSIRRSVQSTGDENGDGVIDLLDQLDINENGTRLFQGDLADVFLNPNKPLDVSDIVIDIRSINE